MSQVQLAIAVSAFFFATNTQARMLDLHELNTPLRFIASESESNSDSPPTEAPKRPDALNSCVDCHKGQPKIPFKATEEDALKAALIKERNGKKNFLVGEIQRRIKLKKDDAQVMPMGGDPLDADTVQKVIDYLNSLAGITGT